MTKEQIRDLDDLDLLNRSLIDWLDILEQSKKKTNEYLQDIAVKEGLHGKISKEKNREILLKYFNNYRFDNETDAKATMYAFLGDVPVLGIKYAKIENVLKDFNREFKFNAKIDENLVMTIKDEYDFIPVLQDYFDLILHGTDKQIKDFEEKYFKKDDYIPGGK